MCRALRERGHNAVLVDAFFGYPGTRDVRRVFELLPIVPDFTVSEAVPDMDELAKKKQSRGLLGENVLELCLFADVVFMALHGEIGENGKLQALFDILDIKYTGTGSLGSALAMQKGYSKYVFDAMGIKTPKGKLYSRGERMHIGAEWLPCIVKPASGGSSVGIKRANTEQELQEALDDAFFYEDSVLVEEYIEGREFTCAVLDGKPLPVAEVVPKGDFYDYAHKYQKGMIKEICPAKIPKKATQRIQQLSLDVFNALELSVYARMDFIMDKDGECYCLEANTLPGLTPTSHLPEEAKAAGIEYAELCEMILEISLRRK